LSWRSFKRRCEADAPVGGRQGKLRVERDPGAKVMQGLPASADSSPSQMTSTKMTRVQQRRWSPSEQPPSPHDLQVKPDPTMRSESSACWLLDATVS
jgi:hypothetical protein